MSVINCVSCRTLRGELRPPGGILYENHYWSIFLRTAPPLVAGQGFIVLNRHCEDMGELSAAEQETLGITMAKTARAMSVVLKPEKVHFGLYGEGVKHIHLHVTPRLSTLPASNIRLTLLAVWRDYLTQIRLRKPISDAEVSLVAAQLKQALLQITDSST